MASTPPAPAVALSLVDTLFQRSLNDLKRLAYLAASLLLNPWIDYLLLKRRLNAKAMAAYNLPLTCADDVCFGMGEWL